MSGRFVRASKYRHVFGQPAKKELCYENLKVTKNAWDSDIIQTNGKYISLNWEASGGGAFAIIPISEVGKAPDTVSLFRGHKGPVLDTSFNPFNQQQIVSCSDDGKILLWDIPEDYSFHKYLNSDDEIVDITNPVKVLSGHTRKVGKVEFHPCAENVIASSSLDYTVKVWNLETGKDVITLQHKDLVTSFAFNYNGSLLVTTSRDKKLRVWNVSTGEIVSEGQGHSGAKPSRVTWVGNTDRFITTGFSRLSDRQVGVWDAHAIDKGPIDGFLVIDQSSGVLIPIFDNSTSILYLAGKGDGNIRYYEFENDYLHDLSQYTSTDPQRGFAAAPKRSVNVKENEILKSYKTVNDHSIEPISFIVPRRSELFQQDIFPDCPSDRPALTASEFFDGKTCNGPLLMSMEALYEGTQPAIHESTPSISINDEKEKAAAAKEAEKKAAASANASPKKTSLDKYDSETTGESAKKSVNDTLKTSSKIDNLLDKVNDSSDIEEEVKSDIKDEEWEDVKKPSEPSSSVLVSETKSEPSSTSSPIPTEVSSKSQISTPKLEPKAEPKAEPIAEPKVEPKAEPKAEPKVEAKAEPKVEPKAEPKAEPKPETKTESKAPTLKATIERLAGIVDNLEAQVTKLAAAGLEKDEKLASLENKIDELLKK